MSCNIEEDSELRRSNLGIFHPNSFFCKAVTSKGLFSDLMCFLFFHANGILDTVSMLHRALQDRNEDACLGESSVIAYHEDIAGERQRKHRIT